MQIADHRQLRVREHAEHEPIGDSEAGDTIGQLGEVCLSRCRVENAVTKQVKQLFVVDPDLACLVEAQNKP